MTGCSSDKNPSNPMDNSPVENLTFNLSDDVLDLGTVSPSDSGKIYAISLWNDTGATINGPLQLTGSADYVMIHQRNCEVVRSATPEDITAQVAKTGTVCTVRLYFTPKDKAPGEYSVEVALGSIIKNISIEIEGSTQVPLTLSIPSVNFGQLSEDPAKDTKIVSFTIRNNNNEAAPVDLSDLVVPGMTVSHNCPAMLSPKSVCRVIVQVKISQLAIGSQSNNLVLNGINIPINVEKLAIGLCTLANAVGNGLSSIDNVVSVAGTLESGNCYIASCAQDYFPSVDQKVCEAIVPQQLSFALVGEENESFDIQYSSSNPSSKDGDSIYFYMIRHSNDYNENLAFKNFNTGTAPTYDIYVTDGTSAGTRKAISTSSSSTNTQIPVRNDNIYVIYNFGVNNNKILKKDVNMPEDINPSATSGLAALDCSVPGTTNPCSYGTFHTATSVQNLENIMFKGLQESDEVLNLFATTLISGNRKPAIINLASGSSSVFRDHVAPSSQAVNSYAITYDQVNLSGNKQYIFYPKNIGTQFVEGFELARLNIDQAISAATDLDINNCSDVSPTNPCRMASNLPGDSGITNVFQSQSLYQIRAITENYIYYSCPMTTLSGICAISRDESQQQSPMNFIASNQSTSNKTIAGISEKNGHVYFSTADSTNSQLRNQILYSNLNSAYNSSFNHSSIQSCAGATVNPCRVTESTQQPTTILENNKAYISYRGGFVVVDDYTAPENLGSISLTDLSYPGNRSNASPAPNSSFNSLVNGNLVFTGRESIAGTFYGFVYFVNPETQVLERSMSSPVAYAETRVLGFVGNKIIAFGNKLAQSQKSVWREHCVRYAYETRDVTGAKSTVQNCTGTADPLANPNTNSTLWEIRGGTIGHAAIKNIEQYMDSCLAAVSGNTASIPGAAAQFNKYTDRATALKAAAPVSYLGSNIEYPETVAELAEKLYCFESSHSKFTSNNVITSLQIKTSNNDLVYMEVNN